jgi:hypothetical protein
LGYVPSRPSDTTKWDASHPLASWDIGKSAETKRTVGHSGAWRQPTVRPEPDDHWEGGADVGAGVGTGCGWIGGLHGPLPVAPPSHSRGRGTVSVTEKPWPRAVTVKGWAALQVPPYVKSTPKPAVNGSHEPSAVVIARGAARRLPRVSNPLISTTVSAGKPSSPTR